VRVLVTGSRNWRKRRVVYAKLSKLTAGIQGQGELVVVHGACPTGADFFADEWARVVWVAQPEPHPAEWSKYGKSAGYRRNAEMADLGADIGLAFARCCQKLLGTKECPATWHPSHGTQDCVMLAEKAGIEVDWSFDYE